MTACPNVNLLAVRWLSKSKHRAATHAVSWVCSHRYGISPSSTCITGVDQHTNICHRFISSASLLACRIPLPVFHKREFHCLVNNPNGAGMLSAAAKEPKGKKVDKGVRKGSEEHGSVLMQFVEKKESPKQLTVGAKVVQAGKDVSYLFVILAGFAVTGFLLWSVGSEFFLSDSPSAIFTKALKRVKADPRVIEALGEPITGHGESSGRGRRRHIANQEYIVGGVSYMRVKFYVDGSKRKGIAYLDLKKNDRGKYECRFLFVELQGYPGGTIVLEDNR